MHAKFYKNLFSGMINYDFHCGHYHCCQYDLHCSKEHGRGMLTVMMMAAITTIIVIMLKKYEIDI